MTNKAWTPLRIVVLVAAGIGTLFWLASLVLWWTMPDASRDGFEIIAIALTTAYFVLLVLPATIVLLCRVLLRERGRLSALHRGVYFGPGPCFLPGLKPPTVSELLAPESYCPGGGVPAPPGGVLARHARGRRTCPTSRTRFRSAPHEQVIGLYA